MIFVGCVMLNFQICYEVILRLVGEIHLSVSCGRNANFLTKYLDVRFSTTVSLCFYGSMQ